MKRSTRFLFQAGLALIVVLLAAFAFTGAGRAVEFIDDNVIPAGVTIDDDVFIGGDQVLVAGTVNGDLFAVGGSVVIDGTVNGSLFTTAQDITINGEVNGTIYAAGASLTLASDARVERNLIFGGFSLEAEPGSTVGRDLLLGGYQGLMSGEVGRNMLVGAAALELRGSVGGDLRVEVAEPSGTEFDRFWFAYMPPGTPSPISPGLRIFPDAEIAGDLVYTSPAEQSGAIQATPQGNLIYQTPVPEQREEPREPVTPSWTAGRWLLNRFRDFLTLLVLGGLAAWLGPAFLNRWADRARLDPLPAAGWGLITVIVGFAVIFLAALLILLVGLLFGLITLGSLAGTIFGLGFSGLGLVAALFGFVVTYISKLVVAYLIGKLVMQLVSPRSTTHELVPMFIGIVIYWLLRSIPFLGWLFGVAATLVGLGAIFMALRDRRMGRPLTPEVPAV